MARALQVSLLAACLAACQAATTTPQPGTTATETASDIVYDVFDGAGLEGLAHDPAQAGRVVVGKVVIARNGDQTIVSLPLTSQLLPVTGFGPADDSPLGISAFVIGASQLHYLGPVQYTADGFYAFEVPELLDVDPAGGPPKLLYPVVGWLAGGQASCPASTRASDPACAGDLLSERRPMVDSLSDGRANPVLLVQRGAYLEFADDPFVDLAGLASPRLGIYLLRVVACPQPGHDACPVWEMAGRLEPFGE